VAFTFASDDEILYDLPVGTHKQRIEGVFGKSKSKLYTAQLLEIEQQTELVTIHGFVGKPESASKQAAQFFFVNGRYMRHPYFHKAVLQAYAGMLPSEQLPPYFIYFDIAPEQIDVNVHPTKTEIKFADEQTIFQILMASVREALGKFTLAPQIDFDTTGSIDIPLPQSDRVSQPRVNIDPNYNPFHTRGSIYPDLPQAVKGWESLYEGLSRPEEMPISQEANPNGLAIGDSDQAPLWQHGKYLFMSTEEGVLLIHPRRAHVCVLYAQFIEQLAHAQGAMQQLLFPEVMTLQQDEMVLAEQLLPDLRSIGFELEQLSPDSYSIQGIPSQLANQSALPVLQEILKNVRERGADTRNEWREQIALSLAQSAAIPSGKRMNEAEMRDLVKRLFALPAYRITPDGKTVVSLMTDEEISKRF
jgi:DNA mismatch repair protein MutL